jgi:acetylornithine deacetylase
MIPFLQDLKKIYDETETSPAWQNDEFDPPTMSLNIGINDHTKALNVKPAQSICTAFYRPLPGIDDQSVIDRVRESAKQHGLELTVRSHVGAVYTDPQSGFVQEAVEVAGRDKATTVSYGTDAGALTELQHKVVCGPGSIAQAHKSDEWIDLKQLEQGTELFSRFIERWCL